MPTQLERSTLGRLMQRRVPIVCLVAFGVGLMLSETGAKDRFTWLLEVLPALVAVPILVVTYARFRFTSMLYVLMTIHAGILMMGGHYTYAEVPLGFWMERVFHFARNDYDRIGHFAQGFVPALVAREILIRKNVVRGRWLVLFVMSFCMAVSALYELFEWLAAVTTSNGATAFLGTQGDPWDTQEDMFMCLVGASVALIAMSRLHDRALRGYVSPNA